MLRYLARRALAILLTLAGVAVLVFIMVRVVPGDIVAAKLRGDGGDVSEQAIAAERHKLGLDKPLVVQFGEYMEGLVTLDLGDSMWTERPVAQEIGIRFGLTLELSVLATVIGVLVAFPLGAIAALTRGSLIDFAVRAIMIGGLAIPGFWLGMLMLLTLLAVFDWLPPITFTPFTVSPAANLAQLIWPALAVGYRLAAVVARMVRSSMLEVLNEDYIRTARSKGLLERMIVTRHALRLAMLPAVTVVGLEFTFLIGGLVVTEQVFNLNGIGTLLVDAVSHSDYTLIQGIVMLIATFYIVVNFLVDITCAALDPRIRAQ